MECNESPRENEAFLDNYHVEILIKTCALELAFVINFYPMVLLWVKWLTSSSYNATRASMTRKERFISTVENISNSQRKRQIVRNSGSSK